MPARLSFNAAAASEAAVAAAAGEDVQEVSFWTTAGAGRPPAGGEYLYGVSVSNDPAALTVNAMYQVAANQLRYDQPEAVGESNRLSARKLQGMIAGGLWMQFHDGARGANGTDNVMKLARVALRAADFTITRS